MKNKKVFFVPRSQIVSDINRYPQPSKKYIPEWYKKMSGSYKEKNGFLVPGPKSCMPFLDSFTSGYTMELATDVVIQYHGKDPKTNRDDISYTWAGGGNNLTERPITTRQEETDSPFALPKFDGYYDTEFQWYTMWDTKTPPGYSTVYHHPNNRFDLPFHTFTGVIDTDTWNGDGPIPFLLKEGFEGVIPAGTPIIQFTFIKRENWKSEALEFDQKKRRREKHMVKRHIMNGYKKEHWKKKEFD
jgi:hypothetical protein